ncbi:MAG: hypothetical protein AAF804_04225 [Bacteroidota bacterium]
MKLFIQIVTPLFWASLITASLGAPVNASAQQSYSSNQHLRTLLTQHEHLIFKLVYEYDPYRKGYRVSSDPKHPQFLAIASDHRYVEYSRSHRQQGTWGLRGEHMIFRSDGSYSSTGNELFRVKSFQGNRLVVAWQGRHGYVERVYELHHRK